MFKSRRIAGLALLVAVQVSQVYAAPDLEYGEYLASECTTCHLLSGKQSNIPAIIDRDPELFIAMLEAYKSRDLENEVMQNIAQRLGASEMESLAAYFATIKPKGKIE